MAIRMQHLEKYPSLALQLKRHRLSVKKAAELSGLSRTTVAKMFAGDAVRPSSAAQMKVTIGGLSEPDVSTTIHPAQSGDSSANVISLGSTIEPTDNVDTIVFLANRTASELASLAKRLADTAMQDQRKLLAEDLEVFLMEVDVVAVYAKSLRRKYGLAPT
ncbi:MAG: hypothetical protein ACRCS3_00840 [Paracoccaceae bacterium]